MTVAAYAPRMQFLANGTTTSFPYAAQFMEPTDLLIDLRDGNDVQVSTVLNGSGTYDYTLDGTLDQTTGQYLDGTNVVFNTAPVSDWGLTITRDPPLTQSLAINQFGKMPAEPINTAFDRAVVSDQALIDRANRSIMGPLRDPVALSMVLPRDKVRANMMLGFDSVGSPAVFSQAVPATPQQILLTSDTSWQKFGSPALVVATHGGTHNAILGYVYNDGPSDSGGYPTGVSGYARIAKGVIHGIGFGLYGLAETLEPQSDLAGGEMTVSNLSGSAPDLTFPPTGATGPVVIGLNVTAQTVAGNDASIGINITNDQQSFTGSCFNTGIYMNNFRTTGLFIEAMPSGTQTGAKIRGNGSGYNLQLGISTAISPNSAVVGLFDSNSALRWHLTQDGSTAFGIGANGTAATGPFLYIGSVAGAPTGAPALAGAGAEALIYDTTNHKLMLYDHVAGAWKGVLLA